MAMCKTTVLRVYNIVMEDVISNVREIFTDEGVDEQVLQELKTLWESKLIASKAVDVNAENAEPPKPANKKLDSSQNNSTTFAQTVKRDQFQSKPNQQQVQQQQQVVQQQQQQVVQQQFAKTENIQTVQQQPTTTVNQAPAQTQGAEDKMIPIQITLPTQPTVDAVTRVLTIHVPASALNGPQLHSLLTGPVITATMGLPTQLASSLLQQHVNAALQSQQQLAINKIVMPQMDGATDDDDGDCFLSNCMDAQPSTSGVASNNRNSRRKLKRPITIEFVRPGVDGTFDTSDEDDDGSEEDASDDEIDEEKEDDDAELDPDGAPEEEPLNSEDDVTDEEPTDLFDTDNVVVCQYDKITRSRNKWKFYLKDGIMNLEGEDFVFQKANGDAEW